jgi:hypothetical protein
LNGARNRKVRNNMRLIDADKLLIFGIMCIVCIALQFILFIPFYLIWRKDCKEIGKENLAVSLGERFEAWMIGVPLWTFPVLYLAKR